MALSIGFRDSIFLLSAIQATRLLTFTSVGLSPTERASLSWSHNRMCGFPASGSRRKGHDVAHGSLLVRLVRQTRPSTSCRDASGNLLVAGHTSLCLAHSH